MRSEDCGNHKNANEELIRPDWVDPTPALCFQVMSKRLCPWCLQNVMPLGTYRMSCAPGTSIQFTLDANPMSKVHTFTDLLG